MQCPFRNNGPVQGRGTVQVQYSFCVLRPELLGGTDAHIYSLHKITVDSLQVVCDDTTLTIVLVQAHCFTT